MADAPVTVCRNNGRNDVAPNITAPSRKLMAKHTAATELPKSLSGRIGSGTRRSWATNATVKIIAATVRPRMTGEPHAYSAPPHTATSMIDDTPATINAAPRKSMRCSWRRNGTRRSTLEVTTKATRPSGRLM